jgi:tetratricopeptide (TPR) repeat protein
MQAYTPEEIRRCFSASTDFNEIFDVFQSALAQKIKDLELYRQLFWNHSLTNDEIRLFGEKLAGEFPDLAYDVFLWLASIFEVTSADNFELALHYYQKAASAKPDESDPYLDACDCYDPDLNIPPITQLIDFLKSGTTTAAHPGPLYRRLSYLYGLAGDTEQSDLYRHKADESSPEPGDPAPAA